VTHDSSLPILGQSEHPTKAGGASSKHPAATPGFTPGAPARSLYIHIPFCFHKCHYCDFYSIVDRQGRQPAFTDRLIRELDALAPLADPSTPLDTVFVGGGTPTLLDPELWSKLLAALHARYIITDATEFTVEANPETVTADLARLLAGGGVNRVSVGAQSFNKTHLKTLERWHDPDNVPRALDLAADAGIDRRSIDLIFAVPGQTLADWTADLDRALALGVTHLSAYNLTYEPATAMTARLHKGEFQPTPEDLEIDMLDALVDRTAAAGLDRYEVSNFATPGLECRHNLAYWRQRDWIAAGPSASGHLAGWRWKNTPRLADYLSDAPLPPATDVEPPDPRRALCERVMTGLRLREGLDTNDLLSRAAKLDPDTEPSLRAAMTELARTDLAHLAHLADVADEQRESPRSRLTLTRNGFLRADGLAADLMSAIDP